MQTGILHPQLENTIGSDHIKQVASFVIEGTVFEIITHNMLNKCHAGSQTNNAWNINESQDQYIARLEYLVKAISILCTLTQLYWHSKKLQEVMMKLNFFLKN